MSKKLDICQICFTFGKLNLTTMKPRFLFPFGLRYLGYLLAIPGFIMGYLVLYQNYQMAGLNFHVRQHPDLFLGANENFTDELALTLVIVGLLFIAFSRLKREDELTAQIRLNALN